MPRLLTHLHLDGTTRQALEFYKSALGGELNVQTVGDTPWAADMPTPTGVKPSPDKVMHATLTTKDWVLMAADMMDPSSFTKGDNYSLVLQCDGEKEAKDIFAKLSAGGTVTMPMEKAPFGWFGTVTDKFGVDWMIQAAFADAKS
jgi:PhnB protein